jgi:hypothetical protein
MQQKNKQTPFRPILFSTPMVKALDQGIKTQTRRIIKLPNYHPSMIEKQIAKQTIIDGVVYDGNQEIIGSIIFPNNIGDVFWVRETFRKNEAPQLAGTFYYKALIDPAWNFKWKPSLFMPKEACRIFLKIKAIRIERLNEISEADAIAEGVIKIADYGSTGYKLYTEPDASYTDIDAIESFSSLWQSINGNGSWDKNPYVFVYEFERIEKPLDFI